MAKPALDVGLVTANASPLLDFYCEVAGFDRLDPIEIPNIGTIHKLACGESILRVMVPASPPEPPPQGDEAGRFSAQSGIRYLTLEVVDIAAAVAAARAAGGRVDLEPFELRPGRRVAQIADPDGNRIELGQDS
jgi:catechol 2,3-dioxygenase-like lactoylglutathione lyase family enzyme